MKLDYIREAYKNVYEIIFNDEQNPSASNIEWLTREVQIAIYSII